ncbi:hypothetical protein BJ878DRAFT_53095 [Calycina marina]|uniref:Uncharacterized protein n=1 Tax=Calycina marina TaxID=1763456 RepID=A0A9P8CFJ1_9HELO|nr:hypothetical protein BJ878DRAFT_53095 [Calycina marina]
MESTNSTLVFWHRQALVSQTASLDDVPFGIYHKLGDHPSATLMLSKRPPFSMIKTVQRRNLHFGAAWPLSLRRSISCNIRGRSIPLVNLEAKSPYFRLFDSSTSISSQRATKQHSKSPFPSTVHSLRSTEKADVLEHRRLCHRLPLFHFIFLSVYE